MAAQELLDIVDGLQANGLLTHTHLLSGWSVGIPHILLSAVFRNLVCAACATQNLRRFVPFHVFSFS